MALESGIIAANTILNTNDYKRESLKRYDVKIHSRMKEIHKGYTKAAKIFLNPLLHDISLSFTGRSKKANKIVTDIFRGTKNWDEVFTSRGFARSFL